MNNKHCKILPLAILLMATAISNQATAQTCADLQLFTPMAFCQTGTGASYPNVCWKQFYPSGAWNCNTTAMNGATCDIQPAAMGTWRLRAFPGTTAMTVPPGQKYCQWECSCNGNGPEAVRIDGSSGLPLELMEFTIDQD